jgi:hypothetical protein
MSIPTLSRTNSLDSQASIEDVEGLDVALEISRATSPVARFVSGVEDDNFSMNFLTLEISTGPEAEHAASVLQRWFQNVKRVTAALVGMEQPACAQAAARLFGVAAATGAVGPSSSTTCLLARLRACSSSEAAIALSSTPEAAKDATAFLTALPRDGVLRKLSVACHGPRAFLAALLVVSQPAVVLGDAHDSPEGKALANASRLVVGACAQLTEVLLEPSSSSSSSPPPCGRLRRFRARLVLCRFARRYHATAFKEWRAFDSERVASQVMVLFLL